MVPPMQSELLGHWAKLGPDQQQRVLDLASALANTSSFQGVSGKDILEFAGTIDAEDAQAMMQAVDKECEQMDHGRW